MSQLTTHILDTSTGRPAVGVHVILSVQRKQKWEEIANGTTNDDGRIPDLLKKAAVMELGTYKLRFETQTYFSRHGIESFYPFVEVSFQITSQEHYHVPLLLNPFGYSTYRGS
jgi:5-hydroxyisourate hydrolase